MNTWLRKSLAVGFALLAIGGTSVSRTYGVIEIPDSALNVPLLQEERSVSTFVPSDTAPGTGLAVNIILPKKARFADGAPIAVVVPGGDSASGLDFSAHTIQCGFAEVRFAFQGGGKKGLTSSGIYDYRGSESQQALRDILQFVGGKITDTKGRHIQDIVPVKLSTLNIGLIGWSNGGNVALATLAKYPDRLRFVSWITFYESPVGSMFFPPNLGGERDLVVNKHYRQGSCATGECLVDYRKLAFDPSDARNKDQRKKSGEPALPGIIYFDENRNGTWDEATEFAFSYAIDVGLDKQIYPPDVTAAMERMMVFQTWEVDNGPLEVKLDKQKQPIPDADADLLNLKQSKARQKAKLAAYRIWYADIDAKLAAKKDPNLKIMSKKVFRRVLKWPDDIASLPESEAYFEDRDGSLYIDRVCAKYPWLLVTVFGSQIDHMQRQPDHPNIALLYNAFLADRAHWVRLNPDPLYVANVANMNPGNFNNNKPNTPIDASAIAEQLEPEGLIPDYLYMNASVSELADRCHAKDPTETLTAVLVNYPYGAGPMPKQEPGK